MNTKLIFCLTAVAAIVGCRESNEKFGSLEQFKPNHTLAVINGTEYRKHNYDLEYSLRIGMKESALKRMDAQKAEQVKDACRQSILQSFIENQLADQMFARTGLVADHTIRTNIETKLVKSFSKRFGRNKNAELKDVESLLNSFNNVEEREVFKRNLERTILVETYLQKVSTNQLTVSEQELDEIEARMRREDEDAVATNRLIYAQATNLWQQAVKGADFAILAEKFSNEPGMHSGGSMGECDANDFKIEAGEDGKNLVWDAVNALEPGEVTPPMNTLEGLTIFKCTSKTNQSENTGAPATCLSRIILHRALLYPEHTRDELRVAILKERRQAALKAFSAELHKDAVITFPHGIAFLPKNIRKMYWSPSINSTATNVTEKATADAVEPQKETK